MGRLAPSSAAQQPDSRSLPFSTHLPSSTSDMGELDSSEIAALKDCFDTFDFFNACRGTIDGTMVGDIMRCAKLNPTQASINANGGTEERGQSEMTFEQVLECRKGMAQIPEGTKEDYTELFLSFDRDATGIVHVCEYEHIFKNLGDKLAVDQYDQIYADTKIAPDEDGMINYNEFLKNLLAM